MLHIVNASERKQNVEDSKDSMTLYNKPANHVQTDGPLITHTVS